MYKSAICRRGWRDGGQDESSGDSEEKAGADCWTAGPTEPVSQTYSALPAPMSSCAVQRGTGVSTADVMYLRSCGGVFGLLVISDAEKAREPQRNALFWVHLDTSVRREEATAVNPHPAGGSRCWEVNHED